MPEEMNQLPDELQDVERLLRGLAPGRRPDRDRVLYEAGREAGSRRGAMRLWQACCGMLVLACAGLIMFPREKIVERMVVQTPKPTQQTEKPLPKAVAQVAPPATPHPRGNDLETFLGLRNAILQSGVDVWREGGGGGANLPALKPGDGLDSLPPWQKRAALSTGDRS